MLKFKILFWLATPLIVISGVATPIIINTLNSEIKKDETIKNESYVDRTKYIIDDIQDINTQNNLLNINLTIKEKFQKILRIIFQIDEYTLWENYSYKINATPTFDFINSKVNAAIEANIAFKWTDKMHGYFGDYVKKRPRTLTFNLPKKNISTPMKLRKELPFANFFEYEFDQYKTNDEQLLFFDNSWYYIFYSVLCYTTYYYKYEIPKQKNYIIKNKITSIWEKFIEINNFLDNQKIHNQNTVKNEKFIKFNKHFSTLYELNQISKIYNELISKNDKTINEKIFIEQLEKYEFNSYENVKKKYDFLQQTGNLLPNNNDEHFFIRVNELLKIVTNNEIDREKINNYNSFEIIYKILINYFANNDIRIKTSFNEVDIDIFLWKNRNFTDIFNQFPKDLQENKNIQILKVKTIIQHKNNENNILYDEYNKNINKKYEINYRWNALNKNPYIKLIKTNGILLNINKYVSEIINDNSLINPKYILNTLNNNIFKEDIFNSIELLSDKNWYKYSNNIDINMFNKFFGLSADQNNFNYNHSDSIGSFFSLVKIDNLIFKDGTSGDFNSNFKNNLINKLNINHNNIFELFKSDNDIYFAIKLQTNRIHII